MDKKQERLNDDDKVLDRRLGEMKSLLIRMKTDLFSYTSIITSGTTVHWQPSS